MLQVGVTGIDEEEEEEKKPASRSEIRKLINSVRNKEELFGIGRRSLLHQFQEGR
jgi:hypothetical protein